MEWSWPESVLLSDRERVMKELIEGRELEVQLRSVLGHDYVGSGSVEGLVNKNLGSFANTLLVLNGKDSDNQDIISDDHNQKIQVDSSHVAAGDSSSWDANHDHHHAIKSEDSYKSCNSKRSTTSTVKGRRGTYERRKPSLSWTRDTPTLTDDGHAWRKYGQKVIHNSKHSRYYYRCTYKFDQACQATKYEQKIQDHPPVFRTTYYNNHTCRNNLKASELVLDYSTSPRDDESSKFMIRFDNNCDIANKQENRFVPSFTPLSVKKEAIIKEEIPTSDDNHIMTNHYDNRSSSSDSFVSSDLTKFESSETASGFSSTINQLGHEDVISRLMMMESYEFDDEIFAI